jgi:RND family efflux transporter MFP subunit
VGTLREALSGRRDNVITTFAGGALKMTVRVVLVCTSMLLISARKKKPAATPPPPTVQVTEVVQQDVPIYREWVGTLDGFVNADIKPQVAGYIQKQAYREGTLIRQGELLFLIDPRNYQDLADQAKSTLDNNLAALAKVRLDVQRDKELIAAQAITRQQLDNDLAAERQAEANVESARAALRQAQLNRGWAQVTSPITGIVGIAQVQVGNLVNTSTTMTTVSQVDPIKAQFNISETEYLRSAQGNHWLEPGQNAKATLDLILEGSTVYPHPGTVIVVNRQVAPQTGTIAIQGSFPNPGNILRPGQYAKVRAVVDTRKGALLVPQRAISELQGTYQVAVVADGKVDVRSVQAGEQVGTMWIIDKGVSVGEKVIVSDYSRLRPGTPVKAVPASEGTSPNAASTSSSSSPPRP